MEKLTENMRKSKREIEAERIEKNNASKTYYRNNSQKILQARKNKKTSERTAVCKEKEIPEYLGKYITFATDGTVLLRFEEIDELRKTLYWLKFKSDYDENVRFPPKKIIKE